jgi:histone H3/H4
MSTFNNYDYDMDDDEVGQPLREGQEFLPDDEGEVTMIDNFLDEEELEEEIAALDEENIEEDELLDGDGDGGEDVEVETKRVRQERETETAQSSSGLPVKIMKKPPSKWLVFLGEQRKIVSEEHPNLSVAQLTKMIADQYKALPTEEHERLDAIVKAEKEKYEEYLRNHPEAAGAGGRKGNSGMRGSGNVTELYFPLARVKKTMKYDEEVKTVSKDALVTVTKALELFVGKLALKSASTAALRGGRTIQLNDVLHTIHHTGNDQFDFLQYDFPKPISHRKSTSASGARNSSAAGNSSSGRKTVSSTVEGKNSIKNFFVGGKRKPDDDNDDGEENEIVEGNNNDEQDVMMEESGDNGKEEDHEDS